MCSAIMRMPSWPIIIRIMGTPLSASDIMQAGIIDELGAAAAPAG
jgi:hypothetical protein